ncbi:Uncharacterised protein [Mycobacteroides abscessus subsp. abscessus]|nr:Uncharacterised protein [Mycobacteroides abscessus subsp. abscessus]
MPSLASAMPRVIRTAWDVVGSSDSSVTTGVSSETTSAHRWARFCMATATHRALNHPGRRAVTAAISSLALSYSPLSTSAAA